MIHEKDFNAARYRGETSLADLKAPVLYTTGNTKISELLRILQKNKAHMAVVVDEYGGTEGIATMEDIVEELVGEIWDEHDEVIEIFRKQPDGSYLIACSADLDDMYDLFQVKGTCDAATVSGWVMEEVGKVPEVGDHFQSEGLDVTVTKGGAPPGAGDPGPGPPPTRRSPSPVNGSSAAGRRTWAAPSVLLRSRSHNRIQNAPSCQTVRRDGASDFSDSLIRKPFRETDGTRLSEGFLRLLTAYSSILPVLSPLIT